MEDKMKLALLIVNHLKTQLQNGSFSEESLESMEVAVQCIESAYKLNSIDSDNVETNLETIIKKYYEEVVKEANNKSELSQDSKKEAEYHKNCGNEFMKNQNNERAIEAYTRSIILNPVNPIYYCNRAAAYNAIGKYNDAIQDCQKSIELDSTYCKAYCRLGLAFSYMKDYHKAVACYKKACELDPENAGYRRNYQLTLDNLQSLPGQQTQPQGSETGAVPPNIMESAARLMTDPEVSSMLTNILGDVSSVGNGGLDRLMQVGQTIVTRLQTSNPNLLDGIRMQFQNAQNEGQPPPPNGFPNDDDHIL